MSTTVRRLIPHGTVRVLANGSVDRSRSWTEIVRVNRQTGKIESSYLMRYRY